MVSSFTVNSCVAQSGVVTLGLTVYTSAGCSGFSIPYSYDMAQECSNNTMVSCEDTPVAITEVWPATGMYIDDSTCTTPLFVAAALPNQCNGAKDQDMSFEFGCNDDSTQMSASAYNDTALCDTKPVEHYDLPTGSCDIMGEFPIPTPALRVRDVLSKEEDNTATVMRGVIDEAISASFVSMATLLSSRDGAKSQAANKNVNDVMVTAYYYSSCGGVESIPGVYVVPGADDGDDTETSSNDDTSSHSNASMGAVGISLIVGFIALAAVGGVLGYLFVVKPKYFAKDNLKEPLKATPVNDI
jgi:hypothetical protein